MIAGLGPDLLSPGFDRAEARRRLRACAELPIGVALLRQSAVAGIGNVYKSEILFLCQTSPHRRVRVLSDEDLDRLLDKAIELLRRNREGYPRVTRSPRRGQNLWVYGRSGRPCAECGRTMRMQRQGLAGRSTYWCPRCQGGVEARRGPAPS